MIDSLRLNHLNAGKKEYVLEIVKEYPDVFHLPKEPLTPTHLVQHKIHTMDKVPMHIRPYRFSPVQKEE